VERRHLRARGRREEVRDRLAAKLVVPVVPHHEQGDLGRSRGPRRAQGPFHPGLCRPGQPADISQRYERWGWPATIIFGPDGTEIVKLRGFYSPRFFIPVLKETVKDPSPVDYGKSAPERERTLATGLADEQRNAILAFMSKAWDPANGGWGKSKLVDGPTLGWFLDRAYGKKGADAEASQRIKRTLTAMIALIDKDSGGSARSPCSPTGPGRRSSSRCSRSRRRFRPMRAPGCCSAIQPIAARRTRSTAS
jgi:hypothetical protein